MAKTIRYSEPTSYFPKALRDKYFKEKPTKKSESKPKSKKK